MKARYELVKDVRGKGLMIGIEFGEPRSLKLRASWALLETMNKGLFCQLDHHSAVQGSQDPRAGRRARKPHDQTAAGARHQFRRLRLDRERLRRGRSQKATACLGPPGRSARRSLKARDPQRGSVRPGSARAVARSRRRRSRATLQHGRQQERREMGAKLVAAKQESPEGDQRIACHRHQRGNLRGLPQQRPQDRADRHRAVWLQAELRGGRQFRDRRDRR